MLKGLSRVPASPCGQCTRVDCPQVDTAVEVADQPFDEESVGDSEDADLVPIQSGEDWVAQLDDGHSDWRGVSYYCSTARGSHMHHTTRMDPV